MKQNYSRMILNRMNISIVAILIVALLALGLAPNLPIYAEKCDQEDDSKCDSKKTSDTEGESCNVEDSENKDKDNENSNMNVQNSNAQSSSSVECTENDSQSNPYFLGEGPYVFLLISLSCRFNSPKFQICSLFFHFYKMCNTNLKISDRKGKLRLRPDSLLFSRSPIFPSTYDCNLCR